MNLRSLYSFFFLIFFICSGTVSAKEKFRLSEKKYKPKNQKILKVDWQKKLKSGSPGKRYFPETSDPVLHEQSIFVGTHGKEFYAVDVASGKVQWKYENEFPISSTAQVFQNKVYFTDLEGHVLCLSATDGSLIWKREFFKEILNQPLITQNKIYFLKGEKEILALDANDGRTVWQKNIQTFVKNLTMRGQSSFVYNSGRLYIGLADGHIYAIDPKDGRVIWEKQLSVPLKNFKDVDGDLVFDDSSLYVGGYFDYFYRLNKSNGKIIWKHQVGTGVTPVILDETVILSSTTGEVFALAKDTGKVVWNNELNRSVLSSPVHFKNYIFVTSFDRYAYLLDAKTGNQVQRLKLSSGSLNDPIVENDEIYVLTNEAQLVKLRIL